MRADDAEDQNENFTKELRVRAAALAPTIGNILGTNREASDAEIRALAEEIKREEAEVRRTGKAKEGQSAVEMTEELRARAASVARIFKVAGPLSVSDAEVRELAQQIRREEDEARASRVSRLIQPCQ
jgi:hypothetical protein